MSWWQTLREGRRLSPQTVDELEQEKRSISDDPVVDQFLRAAFGDGEGAEARETEALERLRSDTERAVDAVASAYEEAPESAYPVRWALVYAAGQIRAAATVPLLVRVLEAEIPPERSNDIHLFSTVAEETSLRCRAVHGLSSLAAAGDESALAALLDQLAHPSYAVRVTACQLLQELPAGAPSEDEIARRLPEQAADQVLAIRRASVESLDPAVEGVAVVRASRPPGGESGREYEGARGRPPSIAPHRGPDG